MSRFSHFVGRNWGIIVFVSASLLLLPLPICIPTQEGKAGYILILVATLWVTEAIPLAVTALLPAVLVPAFGIMTSKEICPSYMKDTIMLFLGGLMLATAIENWNLHKRLALGSLMIVGSKPQWLMLGFMLPCWFLSMWISNTATTAMMVPIVDAILLELRGNRRLSVIEDTSSQQMSANAIHPAGKNEKYDKKDTTAGEGADTSVLFEEDAAERKAPEVQFDGFAKAFTLSIAYAANCGGVSTLTGSGPSMVLTGVIPTMFGNKSPLNFGSWMIYAVPISLLCTLLNWIWLRIVFLGWRSVFLCTKPHPSNAAREAKINALIRAEYKKLGPTSFAEKMCMVTFVILVTLWIAREPGVRGWSTLFKPGFMSDSQPAILIGILLFMLPSRNPFRKRSILQKEETIPYNLMTWPILQNKFPWGVLLLLGGGFALADTCQASGLNSWMGQQLRVLKDLPTVLLIFCVAIGTAFVTEFTSNTATATILLPILGELARCLKQHPFLLMLPCAVASNFAFCLPAATPPNAIVYGKGYLTVKDMIKSGLMANVFCVVVLTLATITYGSAYFNCSVYPDWAGLCADQINRTTTTLAP